jgi:hypothetical protein
MNLTSVLGFKSARIDTGIFIGSIKKKIQMNLGGQLGIRCWH